MLGCALGIVNEAYYPQVDIPQIRDLGFITRHNRTCDVAILPANDW
jgi:Glucodextranase, domain N